jgi:potassium voltage-gated channel Eag-related subfamily H protein 7
MVNKFAPVSNTTVHPHTDEIFLGRWTLLFSVALLFTALATPYELVFMGGTPGLNAIFWLNRIFDLVFIADIVLQFHLCVFDSKEGIWITDKVNIQWRYFKGPFSLDVVSTIPYDLVFDYMVGGGAVSDMKALRILKLLKLAKMLRLMKGMKSLMNLQEMLGISNRVSAICGLSFAFFMSIHWLSCAFGLLTSAQFQPESWATRQGLIEVNSDSSDNIEDLYPYCLYFAVGAMVMGEGGETAPMTPHDRLISIICMVCGGLIYAYLIGSVTEKLGE